MDYVAMEKQLVEHEGERLFPYRDSVGKLTIGIGRNLDDKGITHAEARYMLRNDIFECERKLKELSIWDQISEIRQRVLLDMCFNMGMIGLLGFKRMFEALRLQDYDKAAEEMIKSRWARQVGGRAVRLAAMMRRDEEVDL